MLEPVGEHLDGVHDVVGIDLGSFKEGLDLNDQLLSPDMFVDELVPVVLADLIVLHPSPVWP